MDPRRELGHVGHDTNECGIRASNGTDSYPDSYTKLSL